MCEETHQDSKKLVQNIHKAIDIGALHDTFYYFHQKSEDPDMVGACLFYIIHVLSYSLKLMCPYLIEKKGQR